MNAVDRRPHRIAFLRTVHFGKPQRVGLVVADQLPPEPARLLDDLRMVIANFAVKRGAGADAVAGQHLHDPPDADPVAVIPHGPVPDVRILACSRGIRSLMLLGITSSSPKNSMFGLTQSAT